MPASDECNWQVKQNPNKRHWNEVLKGQKRVYGYKCLFIQGRSSHSGTTRARGEEEQGRHSFNCTTSVLGGRSPAWNGHSGWFRSSAPAFLSSSCSPAVGAASVCPCVGWLQGGKEGNRVSPEGSVPRDSWGDWEFRPSENSFFKCFLR